MIITTSSGFYVGQRESAVARTRGYNDGAHVCSRITRRLSANFVVHHIEMVQPPPDTTYELPNTTERSDCEDRHIIDTKSCEVPDAGNNAEFRLTRTWTSTVDIPFLVLDKKIWEKEGCRMFQ